MAAGQHSSTRGKVNVMLTHDRSPGTSRQPTQEECWANFWRIVGEEAYRIWLAKQPTEDRAD